MTATNSGYPQNDAPCEGESVQENMPFQDLRPSLSAMLDGEATEQDLERLMAADNGELTRQLESYHLIQQALHKEDFIEVGLQDSLLQRVRAGIEVDSDFDDVADVESNQTLLPFVLPKPSKPSRPAWRMALSSMAVAASVAFVIVFTGNEFLSPDKSVDNLLVEVHSPVNKRVITPLVELDKHVLEVDSVRLQHYLRQHAEQAAMTVGQGMIPMARVVSYPIQE